MCRILCYLGSPVLLHDLLYAPPHSLCHQASHPRLQDPGRINADGFGAGWFELSVGPFPVVYRKTTPMWEDDRFATIATFTSVDNVIAAVRNASPGSPIEKSGNSPFRSERHLFTHNGYVEGFRAGLKEKLRGTLSDAREAGIEGDADSEVIFAMVLDRLDDGASMAEAIRAVTVELHDLTTGKFNFMVGDGTTVVATRDGNTLFSLTTDDAQIIASEPFDDDVRWTELPDRTLTTISRDAPLTTVPL
jgi:glutamine amidotransferase